jgi:hypothetical protein
MYERLAGSFSDWTIARLAAVSEAGIRPMPDLSTPANSRVSPSLAAEYEPSAQAIRSWMRQADREEGKRHDGLTSEEKVELGRLRREVRTLREERAILARAAACRCW